MTIGPAVVKDGIRMVVNVGAPTGSRTSVISLSVRSTVVGLSSVPSPAATADLRHVAQADG